MKMHNPPHPGEMIKECLYQAGTSMNKAAKQMGMSQGALSLIINGKRKITPASAEKIAAYYGTSAQSWLDHQASYDSFNKDKK